MKSQITYTILLTFLILGSCDNQTHIETKHPNGKLAESFHVRIHGKDSMRTGSYLRYDENGAVLEESNYLNGKLNGLRKLYINGILSSIETRVDDNYHGPFTAYHENGNIQLEANYVNDVMLGPVKVYYPEGGLKEIVNFENNAETGPFTEYHPNGKLKAEGSYQQSDGPVEHGELRIYDTSGILLKIMQCDMGKCTTTWKKDALLTN